MKCQALSRQGYNETAGEITERSMCSALKIPIEVSVGTPSWLQLPGAQGGVQPGAVSLQKRAGRAPTC